MANSAAADALTQAATGLSYQSETDALWKPVRWPRASGDPTPEGIRKQGKHKADSPVEEQKVEDFFAPLTQDQDWFGEAEKADAAKYRALLSAVKVQLQNPKVVKIGERKCALYVIGTDPSGGWTGLKTTAVET